MASERLEELADAFRKLTYREMQDCAEVLVEALDGLKGLKVKPEVMCEALDAFGTYLEVEVEETD